MKAELSSIAGENVNWYIFGWQSIIYVLYPKKSIFKNVL